MVDRRMAFLKHVAELRKRIIYSVIAISVAGSVCFYYAIPLIKILVKPAQIAGSPLKLVYLSPLEPFMVKFKVAMFGGVALALPVILYQILSFVAPALKKKERRFLFPSIVFLVILFFAGAVFGYYYIMPVGTSWLLDQAGGLMQANVAASMYVTYAGWFLLGFGLSFETPLFILILVRLGVLSPQRLRSSWRYAVLIILVAAAVITPDWNPVTMAIMAGPMLLFYLLSCALAGFVAPKPLEETLDE
jgi:sec-independent protein translocase protein TatC